MSRSELQTAATPFVRHDPGGSDALATGEARRPRRRVAAAIAASYGLRLLLAAIASYPFVASVSASGIGGFDAGDGKLFEPGGLYLLEVLVHQRAVLLELVAPTALLLLAGSLAGVVPEWLLLRALGGGATLGEASNPVDRGPRRALARLVLVALASWVARGLLVFATAALAMTARSYFVSARDERLQLLAAAVAVLVGLAGWLFASLLHDLCAIEITLGGATPLDAIERALGALRRQLLGLASRYAAWGLAGMAALVAGAAAGSAIDVSAGGSAAPIAAAALHQLAILAQIALHAAWLSSAIRASARCARGREPEGPQAEAFL